jgi:dTDP-L-rhamnose 4-epimerase
MAKKILITGGAGFIGSHLADGLLERGHSVRVLDNLSPQVHPDSRPPAYLSRDVELQLGDVRDAHAVRKALQGIDVVYHLAAMVGVGQSMYEIVQYTAANNMGTAVLLEAVINRPVECLVVASSMSIYGEGLYRRADGATCEGEERSLEQLKSGDWELADEIGQPLVPIPTIETKTPSLASVYALSKFDQERMCLVVGRAYGIPAVALRFFNVYGPRQALSNPYTGVLAIFASRYLNNQPPIIYEDGHQKRDFVSVHDVALACRLAMESPQAAGHAINVGSGYQFSVLEIADRMSRALEKGIIPPQVSGRYRAGDIRHCFANISLARKLLGYEPQVSFERGLAELASWLERQVAVDRFSDANAQLAARGLTL